MPTPVKVCATVQVTIEIPLEDPAWTTHDLNVVYENAEKQSIEIATKLVKNHAGSCHQDIKIVGEPTIKLLVMEK